MPQLVKFTVYYNTNWLPPVQRFVTTDYQVCKCEDEVRRWNEDFSFYAIDPHTVDENIHTDLIPPGLRLVTIDHNESLPYNSLLAYQPGNPMIHESDSVTEMLVYTSPVKYSKKLRLFKIEDYTLCNGSVDTDDTFFTLLEGDGKCLPDGFCWVETDSSPLYVFTRPDIKFEIRNNIVLPI
jgi:hypothetical protein